MNNEKVDKPVSSSEIDKYDKDYFIRLLLVFVIFALMHISTK